jgi:hypothetical protein
VHTEHRSNPALEHDRKRVRVTSGYEPTRELRELLIKKTFLGDLAPNEREESVPQYVIHRVKDDVHRADERVCAPRARGV